jgi:phosphate acyltransferase
VRSWLRKRTSTITSSALTPGGSPLANDDTLENGAAGAPGTIVVALDANGADLGPREVAAGAALAAQHGVRVLLFGAAAELGDPPAGVQIVDAPLSVAKSADPASAVRASPDASIVQAARAVADGRAQALVCAGGTGAALAAGLFHIKRAPGIHRPALALALPVPGHPVTLLDVGANAQARSEHLVQFAFMGAAFAQAVLGVRTPRVALLSNGEEASRGSELVMSAGEQLAQRMDGEELQFVGNVEGGDLVSGAADVIVTDGFTGNVALKLMEGVSETMLDSIRAVASSSTRGRIGGLLLRSSLRSFRDRIDPEAQGGAYLLGLRHLIVAPHGRFARKGFAEAILRAARAAEEDVPGVTHAALQAAGALRRAPMSADAASLTCGS